MNDIIPDSQPREKVAKSGFGWTDLFLQILLIGLGLFVSMPIWLAFFSSFKVPESIITFPPTLLPTRTLDVELEGYDEPLPLFDVTFVDGSRERLARIEQAGADFIMIEPESREIFTVDITQENIVPARELFFTIENYITAWTSQPLFRYFVNSVIQTGIIVVFQIVFSILAAYAFAVLDFPGRNMMFYLILGSLMVPFQLTFIPNFMLISQLGWANTYQGLTVPFLASAFGVFMLRQFFMTVPKDYHDSARIDGASNWRYLWQIMVPLSKGSISAFGIFAFLSAWSQYLWPLIITNDQSMRTIQIGIRFFLFDQERGADWGGIMAAAIIALLPTLLIFLVAQRQLVKGIAMSGLKG